MTHDSSASFAAAGEGAAANAGAPIGAADAPPEPKLGRDGLDFENAEAPLDCPNKEAPPDCPKSDDPGIPNNDAELSVSEGAAEDDADSALS